MKHDFQNYLSKIGEIGFVEKVVSSLVYIQGLPGAKPEELLVFENGELGQVSALAPASIEVMGFSKAPPKVGTRVTRTDEVLQIPIGEGLLGHIINPLGHSLDPVRPTVAIDQSRPVNIVPAGIETRVRIKRPCETGVTMVDFLIPIGKGQRELVMGDQKTGKTKFLLRTLLAQVRQGAVGVYAIIGKGQIAIKQIEESIRSMGVADKVVLVVSSADDTAGMINLTPYSAMTIAEYFRDSGQDVLLVLDDLSVHAKAYRELSLLGRRYPGRNSYPGDIFYAHAKLLERAGNFKGSERDVAITCFPVVEAFQGDITGYIQTNLMSMTDGHLFFDHKLFAEGRRPAVDPFLSVTRIGLQTQSPLRREIGRTLFAFLRNIETMRRFSRFGAEVGEELLRSLKKEERITHFLDQTVYDYIPVSLQIFLFGVAWGERWESKTTHEIRVLIHKTVYIYETNKEVRERIDQVVRGANSIASLTERIQEFVAMGQAEFIQ